MTISKRNSRRIVVNGEYFRWAISLGSGYLTLVVEHETIKGQKIEVYIESDINNVWVNFPYVENMNMRLVKPSSVREIIVEAINMGWNYKLPGSPIVFDLKNERIKKR
ncbi:hypothetical protein AMS62_19765 [Bacillus sp. FJAT-18019]|nr:hypothetical protein AMS62_19765 [Bacillus sp. FJAT-18019]